VISFLEDGERVITEDNELIQHAVQFYKENMSLDDNFWAEDKKVTTEENDLLRMEFSEEEVKKAIDGSYAESAPCTDGFSFLFY
jgi:hypothetical protein